MLTLIVYALPLKQLTGIKFIIKTIKEIHTEINFKNNRRKYIIKSTSPGFCNLSHPNELTIPLYSLGLGPIHREHIYTYKYI